MWLARGEILNMHSLLARNKPVIKRREATESTRPYREIKKRHLKCQYAQSSANVPSLHLTISIAEGEMADWPAALQRASCERVDEPA